MERTVPGTQTCRVDHLAKYADKVTRPAAGSTYRPVTRLAVISSSHPCASVFVGKCPAYSLPASSRYRAR
jgi:hypothetical protein